ncbi:hypothetical protein GP486_008510 [Trichoglossum hirsutum]|uniref:Uncharacterized protein n=1 Tax=Trichoglossum hirsutum TaxID=265104 RepID=A0A9P8L5G2_9PEZI|nr:hypothetical protein GP486_008510 [Trichoglossum hirsutum]
MRSWEVVERRQTGSVLEFVEVVELREIVEVEKVEEKEVEILEELWEVADVKDVEEMEKLREAVEVMEAETLEGLREVAEVEELREAVEEDVVRIEELWEAEEVEKRDEDEDDIDPEEPDAEEFSCSCSGTGRSSGRKSLLYSSFWASVSMSGRVTFNESEGPPVSKTRLDDLKSRKKACAARERRPKSEGKPNDLWLEDERKRKAKRIVSDGLLLLCTGTAAAVAVAKKAARMVLSRVGVVSVNDEKGRMTGGTVVVGVVVGVAIGGAFEVVLVPEAALVLDAEPLLALVGVGLLE